MSSGRKTSRRERYGLLALAGMVVFVLGSVVGRQAGNGGINQRRETYLAGSHIRDVQEPKKDPVLSGTLRLAGSSSMEKLASELAEGFMDRYPDVIVTIEFVGSAAGIEAVLNGSADIGNASRSLKKEELAKGAVEHILAMDGTTVCVDPANTVTGLTRQQLIEIYTGKLTNWSELGGADVPVVVIGQEAGSGTRASFEEQLGIEDRCVYANELNSSGAVMARVALIPGAIGYLSLAIVDDTVIALPLDGVEPTAGNVRDGSYPLCRPFAMVTKGEISAQNELVQAWFDYVHSVGICDAGCPDCYAGTKWMPVCLLQRAVLHPLSVPSPIACPEL